MRKIFSFVAAALFAGSMMAADLLNIDFTKGQGDWTINDVNKDTLSYVWKQDSQYGMKATAYVGAAHATESWLISPAIDLTGVTASKLAFSQALNKGEVSSVSVKAKAGSGEWANLTVAPLPAGNSWTFIDSEADLAAYVGKANVQIAFVYTSTTTSAATWEIKTVSVNDGVAPAPADVVFTGEDFLGQGTSSTGSAVSATKGGVTFSCDKGYSDDANKTLRCYKNGVITITSETEQIGLLKFKFYSTYTGDLANEVVVNAKSWNYTLTNQARIEKLEIYFGIYDTIPAPPTPPAENLDTITVAKALEIGQALADGAKTDKKYVIAGYSSAIETVFSEQYKNETFWMADSKESTAASNADGAFYVYRGTLTPAEEMGVHAKIFVTSVIKKYMKGSTAIIETDGSVAVNVVEKGVIEKPDTINVAQALEIGQALASGAVSAKEYVIKGYVSSIQDFFNEQYKNETFWITDTKGDRTSDKTKAFEVYRGKPNTEKEIGLEAYIQIQCKIKNYNGTIENDGVNLPFEVLEQGLPVETDTVSVAEALAIGMALEDNAYTDNPYYVIGYVTKAYEPDSGKTQQNFYMADDPDERGEFYAYKASPDSKIADGDYVQLFGKIQKYVGSKGTTIELSYGTATHLQAPQLQTLTVAQVQALDLAEGATTEERFIVIGYVAAITAEYEEDLQSFNLSDDAAAVTGEFACIDAMIAEPGAVLHDNVKITGKIQKLNGAFRMVGGKAVVINGQGLENIVLTEKAQKVLMDGVIYIIRDNKIYNLQGTQVR